MGISDIEDISIDTRIALRLKGLRTERGWSLDILASRSGVSRATLSRLENAEVSATANVLGKLCAAYGLTMSRLMLMVEDEFTPVICHGDQQTWVDPETGFRRRQLSPPSGPLAGEVLECALRPATVITYDAPPKPGLEHHLVLMEGQLEIRLEGETHHLRPDDCLRYQLFGSSTFVTPDAYGARYMLFIM